MKNSLIALTALGVLLSCRSDHGSEKEAPYLRWVGDIEHNNEIDKVAFTICNGEEQVFQYFNIGEGPIYKNEKSAILNAFHSQYKSVEDANQNGLIRIRFIVNCQGQAGRFRLIQSDNDYQPFEFDKHITTQLLEITKRIEGWQILYKDGVAVDYYMYLIFKIKNGKLIEILP